MFSQVSLEDMYGDIAFGGDGDDIIDAHAATHPVYLDVGTGTGAGYQFAMGGVGGDKIVGSDSDDVIIGAGGNDLIDGKSSDDVITGDDGADTITGGAGFDWIWGGGGPDSIDGGANDDMIWSGEPSMAIGPTDQFYNGVGVPGLWWTLPDMFGTGGGGNNTVDGHEEPLGGGGYNGPSGGIGGGATGAAMGDAFSGAANVPMVISGAGVLGNDAYDDEALLVAEPQHGDVQVNANGSFVYTSDAGFEGSDSFYYIAYDASTMEWSEPTAVILIILANTEGVVHPPEAYNDFFSADATVGATVGSVETFHNANALQVVNGAGPSHGSLVLAEDGTYTYTPDPGYIGIDSFQYVAINTATGQQSAPATVTIFVYSTQPVAYQDSYSVNMNAVLTVNTNGVLVNDPWGDTAQLVSGQGPTHGTLTLNSNGTFTYTPASGYIGSDTFQYRAINSSTGQQSAPQTVTIDVVQLPQAVADSYTTNHATTLTAPVPGVLANDTSASSGAKVAGSGPNWGTLTFNADGSFTYVHNPSFGGYDSFQYRAINAAGEQSAPATVTIRVFHALPIAVNDEFTTTIGFRIDGMQPTANDTGIFYGFQWLNAPSHGSIVHIAGQGYRYTPDPQFEGDEALQYFVTNPDGVQSAPATVTIHVMDSEPVAVNDAYTIGAGGNLGEIVLTNDQWANSIQLISGTSHGQLTLEFLSGAYTGMFSYIPAPGFVGDDHFQYRAVNTYSGHQSTFATVTIHVSGPIANDDYYAGQPNSDVEGCFRTNDEWEDDIELVSGPANGSFYFLNEETGDFVYRPNEGFEGYDSFQYRALNTAQGLQSSIATVTIYIGYDPLTLNRPAIVSNEPILVMSQLLAIGDEAIRRWRQAGVSDPAVNTMLSGVQFVIADLPGSHLGGNTKGGKILIDINAAGHGWFVDRTATEESEFTSIISRSEHRATSGSLALDRADLLTVVMHELGHYLGLDHAEDPASTNIMAGSIDLGVRRVPTSQDAALVDLLFTNRGRRRRF
jgi:hypothetical protein